MVYKEPLQNYFRSRILVKLFRKNIIESLNPTRTPILAKGDKKKDSIELISHI